MAASLRERVASDDIPFTVIDNQTGRRIGSISLLRITPAHGVVELGYIWYEPGAQRTKANTEANFLLLRHCFEQLRYRRIEWKCDSENARSRAAALRLGKARFASPRQFAASPDRSSQTKRCHG